MHEDNDNKILLKLRDIRRAKGMSLNSLAEKVGIDYQRVGRMERGETQMTVDMLNKMSRVLNVPLSELIDSNLTAIENRMVNSIPANKTTLLIPTIYKKIDVFCNKHNMEADPSVKVHLATEVFNALEEMRINQKDDEGMVKALFQVLDAIFEKLVVNKTD